MLLVVGSCLALAALSYRPPVILNVSESVPVGLYYLSFGPPRTHRLVTFCLPKSFSQLARTRGYIGYGACPGQAARLLKHVAATAGDRVVVGQDGTWINGQLIPDTQPQPKDSAGRPIPAIDDFNRTLSEREIWTLGPHPKSFDSRYYGPIHLSQARAFLVKPLWTWSGEN